MAAPEMQKAISRLRLTLAALKGKEEEIDSLRHQFRRQLRHSLGHAVHGNSPLDTTLSVMDEIQERLDAADRTLRHLTAIKQRAEDELQALDLTQKIERAKTRRASLKESAGKGTGMAEQTREEIESLDRFIQETSVRAGEAITEGPDSRAASDQGR